VSAVVALLGWIVAAGASSAALRLWLERGRRAELVARAGHELRGPLTAAVLALHAAGRDGDVPADTVAAVELELLRAGAALDDLSVTRGRIAAGGLQRCEPVEVGTLLACQVKTWGAVARAHGRALRLRGTSSGPIVWGDRVRLAQASGNLIANAIEHGRGPVELQARTMGDRVRIEVLDSGPGLPLPVGVLARRRRAGRGSRGRGLAIASAIVTVHGGRLAAAPSTSGARLAIDLPAYAGAGLDVPAAAEPDAARRMA
jgi:signal transduction histidine kinase